MKVSLACTLCAVSLALAAEQKTIDLEPYKNAKKYTYAEVSRTIGTHAYTFVNVRPKAKSDTACISALVIDKRKYLMVDLFPDSSRTGIVIPESQPVENGLLAIKVSPLDAKTFIILASGKVVTLPGDYVIVDQAGKTVLVAWDNGGSWLLSVLDYRKMNLLVQPTSIAKPVSWYTNGLAWYFKADGEQGYYTIDLLTKSISKAPSLDGDLDAVPYTFEPSKLTPQGCCGKETLGK